jgi:hypothetical protein
MRNIPEVEQVGSDSVKAIKNTTGIEDKEKGGGIDASSRRRFVEFQPGLGARRVTDEP